MGIGGRRRHFCVIQVLPTLPVSVEPRREHGVAVFIQKLADEAPGLRGEARFLRVHVLLMPWGQGRRGLWKTKRVRGQHCSLKHNCLPSFLKVLGDMEFRRPTMVSHFSFKIQIRDTMPQPESPNYLTVIIYLLSPSSLAFKREFARRGCPEEQPWRRRANSVGFRLPTADHWQELVHLKALRKRNANVSGRERLSIPAIHSLMYRTPVKASH